MPEDKPEDKAEPRADSGQQYPSSPASPARLKSLTPEQRRFLGTPRAGPPGRPAEESPVTPVAGTPEIENAAPESRRIPQQQKKESGQRDRLGEERSKAETEKEGSESTRSIGKLMVDERPARVFAVHHAFLVIGAIFVLGLTFYVGKKYPYWKYLIMTQREAKLAEKDPDKFPGVPAGQLVEQALVAEHSGKWQEAVERLISARRKNRALPGILFHVGKILLEHHNPDAADQAFERAIALGEDVDTANYGRGLIALHKRNLPGAERFFEAAANAKPLMADYYFYWADALRLDGRPREAIPHYQQAALRTDSAKEEKVIGFKIRIADAEAGAAAKVSAEVEEKRQAGPLSVDWLMTAAALKIREGHIDEAVQLLSAARLGKDPGLFAACVKDFVFQDASLLYPEVAKMCKLNFEPPTKFP